MNKYKIPIYTPNLNENESIIQMSCNICKHQTRFLFKDIILNKYLISYFQCSSCNFIQTESPYWLDEAYKSAIGLLDIGLLSRNIRLREEIKPILNLIDTKLNGKFLDYGGGFGVFVRLMRDSGFDFFLFDRYCDNLFAKLFELKDTSCNTFNALTSFEVFEHLPDPISEIDEMWKLSDTIIFTTELQPDIKFKSTNDWWYFAPIGGQHLSFYHIKTLQELAAKYQCNLYSNGTHIHILTKTNVANPFTSVNKMNIFERIGLKFIDKFAKKNKRPSLQNIDVEYLKNKLS